MNHAELSRVTALWTTAATASGLKATPKVRHVLDALCVTKQYRAYFLDVDLTITARFTDLELLAILAHEAGHIKLGHLQNPSSNHSIELAADRYASQLVGTELYRSALVKTARIFGDAEPGSTHPALKERLAVCA